MRGDRIAHLRSLLEEDPGDSFTRYALALELAALGSNAEAAALLQDLIGRDPSYVPAFQQLGYLYQKLERRGEAAEIFQRGLALASAQGDSHAAGEIRDALDELSAS